MKKVSKIISIFMAVVLALSVFAVSASAVATPLTAGNTKETATKIPSYGTEYVSELVTREVDWFKFTTLSDDAYYTIAFKNYSAYENILSGEKIHTFIYDSYLQQIDELVSNDNTNLKLEPIVHIILKLNKVQ